MKLPIKIFEGDSAKGIAEINWFFLPRDEANPFNAGQKASGIYYLYNEENQLIFARQESLLWKFNEQGEPQEYGGIVMDAARMILADFKTRAEKRTVYERADIYIREHQPHLTTEAIESVEHIQLQCQRLMMRNSAINRIIDEETKPHRNDEDSDLMEFLQLQGFFSPDGDF